MKVLSNILKGVAVGLANIIPGVSGGTMLLILGVYERVIKALHNVGLDTVKALFGGRQRLVEALRRIDAFFLLTLATGALVAVVAVAKLMIYLLQHQHDPTYGFFFGLVLISVVVPYRMIRRKGLATLLSCVIAISTVVGTTVAVSGEQRLASAQAKAELKAKKAQARAEGREVEVSSGRLDARSAAIYFGAGAVAIAAMILPGISGSFMLLLMGVYFEILTAITARNLPLLAVFALGCALGLLLFTRVLNFLLERYHDVTMAFLLGLVIGSLWAIWPFKKFAMAGDMRVDLHNTLPTIFGINEVLTTVAIVIGCAVVGFFIWLENRHPTPASS